MSDVKLKFKSITITDVQAEVTTLRGLRSNLIVDPGLDAQIDVLAHGLAVQQVRRKYAADTRVCGLAMTALGWRNGWQPTAPSKVWGSP